MEINIFFRKNPPIKAFTLIELIVVIIIVGILAAVGISQYARMVEKTRSTEAKMIFGDVRKFAYQYRLENGTLTGMTDAAVNIGTGADQIPSACRSTHYFKYWTRSISDPYFEIQADRCATGGKSPQGNSSNAFQWGINLSTGSITEWYQCASGWCQGWQVYY